MFVGTGREVINPQAGHLLCGYGDNYPCEGVHDDLTVTALYLHDGATAAVLLNYDLLGIAAPLGDRIRAAVSEKTAISKDQIFLASTHTHSGPFLREWSAGGPQRHRPEYNDGLVEKSAA